jgi:hypothetical protein
MVVLLIESNHSRGSGRAVPTTGQAAAVTDVHIVRYSALPPALLLTHHLSAWPMMAMRREGGTMTTS